MPSMIWPMLSTNRLPVSRRLSGSSWQLPVVALLLLTALVAAIVLDNGLGLSLHQQGASKQLGVALGLGSLIPTAGKIIGGLLGKTAVKTTVGAGTAVLRSTGSAIGLPAVTTVAKRGALLAAGGAAFELGSRALPGGPSFPGGSMSSGGGQFITDEGAMQPGARFGDTFITRIWQSGVTREGVPIVHGMLANGKRFSTNRFGSVKVFTPRKNIVIGPDPKLSDATKVVRAIDKMDKAARSILKAQGFKAVRAGR